MVVVWRVTRSDVTEISLCYSALCLHSNKEWSDEKRRAIYLKTMQQMQKKNKAKNKIEHNSCLCMPHMYLRQYDTNRGWVEIVGLWSSSRVTVVSKCSTVLSFLLCSHNAQRLPWVSAFTLQDMTKHFPQRNRCSRMRGSNTGCWPHTHTARRNTNIQKTCKKYSLKVSMLWFYPSCHCQNNLDEYCKQLRAYRFFTTSLTPAILRTQFPWTPWLHIWSKTH